MSSPHELNDVFKSAHVLLKRKYCVGVSLSLSLSLSLSPFPSPSVFLVSPCYWFRFASFLKQRESDGRNKAHLLPGIAGKESSVTFRSEKRVFSEVRISRFATCGVSCFRQKEKNGKRDEEGWARGSRNWLRRDS